MYRHNYNIVFGKNQAILENGTKQGECYIMNNSEKNTFVKNRITETFIKLLEQKRFDEISICEITDCAQVSRNSFYRNYSKKEDILVCYIEQLLRE